MTTPIAPTETDIEVIQGATFTMRVTWQSDDDPPVPISLAGYYSHMQIRSKTGGFGVLLADLSSVEGSLIQEPGGLTGVIDVRISALVTASLTKTAYYDLFVVNETDPTEAVRLVFGSITMSLSATVNT